MGQRDGDDHILQVEGGCGLILDVNIRLSTRQRGPAIDSEGHEAFVLTLHAPLEDAQLTACVIGSEQRNNLEQQLMVRGTRLLSLLCCSRAAYSVQRMLSTRKTQHTHTQVSASHLPVGKGREGSFSPNTLLEL